MSEKRARGLFVTGTDTGVGKTIVAAGLAAALRGRGFDVGVMKPVCTGAVEIDGRLSSDDASFLKKAIDSDDPWDLVNPYCLIPPAAPSVAAEATGIDISLQRIVEAFAELSLRHQVVVVEGVGGLLVPIVGEATVADLAKLLDLPLLVVARPALGTINHSVLTVKYAESVGLTVIGTIISGYPGERAGLVERTNPTEIARLSGRPILGLLPDLSGIDVAAGHLYDLVEAMEKSIDLNAIIAFMGIAE